MPPLPATLSHPEFAYPAVPPPLASADAVDRIDRAWRYLQNDDLASADREFLEALERVAALYPARAGSAYVALARREYDRALVGFEEALRESPGYVPALVGRGRTLLLLERNAAALEAFEAALAADPSLADIRRTVDVLRFRSLQDVIEAGRAAAVAGRAAEARDAYQRALEVSPDSTFLHRELGLLERKEGNAAAALERFRRAAELDGADAVSLVQIGELLEERQDFTGAGAAYGRAADVEPSPELSTRIAAVAERARESRLPAEFRAIAASERVSRGDLAALLGVRLEETLRSAPAREVVMTDTGGHWAASWVAQVARAGVMDPYPNHTFQPGAGVTRADLAGAVSRLVRLLAAERPDLRAYLTTKPRIVDMAEGHLSYAAAAVAVAAGAVPLVENGLFQPTRPVSGGEAMEAIARLQALATASR